MPTIGRRASRHDRRAGTRPAAAGRRRRRPAERRQVDAGQPHPRPPRGGRAGRPRRDPRPDRLRRAVERPAVHPGRHRRLGAGRPRAAGDGVGAGRARRGDRRPRAVRRRRPDRRHRDRPGRRPHAAPRPSGRWSWRSTRSTTSAARPTPPSCGRSGSASRTRSAACTGAAAATCSTPCSTRCPRRRARRDERGRPAPGGAGRAAERRQVEPAQPAGRRGALGGRLGRRHHRSTRSTACVELGGEIWRFVDTAGLRRRVHQASGMEYYASLRTAAAIEAAEVAVVLLDAVRAADREQDQRVIAEVVDAGRALVLAFNKWDLRRRGPPAAAGARDRPRPGPGGVGAAGQRLGQDRPRRSTSSPPRCGPRSRPGTGGSRPAG